MRLCYEVLKVAVEPSGAIGLAVVLSDQCKKKSYWREMKNRTGHHIIRVARASTGARYHNSSDQWPVVRDLVDDVIVVDDEEIVEAMRLCYEVLKVAVEPSGAIGLAVVLSDQCKKKSYWREMKNRTGHHIIRVARASTGARYHNSSDQWPVVRDLVDDVIVVDDEEIVEAMRLCYEVLKVAVEPSGAIGLAVVLSDQCKKKSYWREMKNRTGHHIIRVARASTGARYHNSSDQWPVVRDLVDDVIVVDDEEIVEAMRLCYEVLKVAVEPSGAIGLAVVLSDQCKKKSYWREMKNRTGHHIIRVARASTGARYHNSSDQWPVVRDLVDDVIVVDDEEIVEAMRLCYEVLKVAVEPSGAIGLAVVLSDQCKKKSYWREMKNRTGHHIIRVARASTGARYHNSSDQWPVVRDLVDDVIVVDDEEIVEAMRLCYEVLKVAVEPSGAIGLAVVLSDQCKKKSYWREMKNRTGHHIIRVARASTGARYHNSSDQWPVVRDLVDDVIVVDDEEIVEAMRLCYEVLKVAVEPSGAIGLAVVLSDQCKKKSYWREMKNGTISLELLEQAPELDTIIVPISGGGLISGITLAAKSINPSIRVLAAEPKGADDSARSKLAGRIVHLSETDTLADGLRASLGDLTWPVVRDLVDDVIVVDDEEIVEAMRLCYEVLKAAVEPSGAIGLAAVLSDQCKKKSYWREMKNRFLKGKKVRTKKPSHVRIKKAPDDDLCSGPDQKILLNGEDLHLLGRGHHQ
ncbi:Serine racemase [Platanthera guangdongensis]|uniref:Serine racemase n=1 Tax=Platanthera guangdongensis TaxID=2320717 RepID=A0ABR2MTG8_9ASPA